MTERFIDVHGGHIHAIDAGAGPPIVLLDAGGLGAVPPGNDAWRPRVP